VLSEEEFKGGSLLVFLGPIEHVAHTDHVFVSQEGRYVEIIVFFHFLLIFALNLSNVIVGGLEILNSAASIFIKPKAEQENKKILTT
jgi:hypothetical protein